MFMKCHEKSLINSGHLYSVPPYNKEVKYDIAQQRTLNEELTHKLQKNQNSPNILSAIDSSQHSQHTQSLIHYSWHYV